MANIMLVDDESSILKALKRTLKPLNCEIDTFDIPEEAVAALDQKAYALIISDYRMPELDGVTLLRFAKEKQPAALRIILSGQTDVQGLLTAINDAHIYRFIAKPWDDAELVMTLRNCLQYAELMNINMQLLSTIENQKEEILRQQHALALLEKEHPGITKVLRNEEGYIILEEDES